MPYLPGHLRYTGFCEELQGPETNHMWLNDLESWACAKKSRAYQLNPAFGQCFGVLGVRPVEEGGEDVLSCRVHSSMEQHFPCNPVGA